MHLTKPCRSCAPAELEPGRTIGEYVIDRQIAEGGFGVVYAATHPVIGKRAAIKMLSPEYSEDPEFVARFLSEARVVNEIRHRNIVDIFGFGQLDDGRHYYVMELLEGWTLDELLDARGRVPFAEALPILDGVSQALDAAHRQGIVHRDLKPENVFLVRASDGSLFPKLLDFGVAKSVEPSTDRLNTEPGRPLGTLPYMSPEQCRGRDVDARTDVYAFGVLAYRMLTGRLPHEGCEGFEAYLAKMQCKIPKPSELRSDIPEPLDDALLQMMAKDAEDRPESLTDVIQELQLITDRIALEGLEVEPPKRSFQLGSVLVFAASAVLFLLSLFLTVPTVEAPAPKSDVLRFGYRRSVPDEVLEARFSKLTEYLSRSLDRPVEFVIRARNEDLREELASGELAMAVMNPLGYAQTKGASPKILAAQVNPGGGTFEGYILARAGSGIRELADLRDRPFCFVPDSTSGYLYPWLMLHEAGADPETSLRAARYAADHVWAMRHLAAGDCDGAAVYSYTYLDARSYGVAPNAFTIIAKTPRIPNDVFVVSPDMDPDLAEAIKTALLALEPESAEARRIFPRTGELIGFAPADVSRYDQVKSDVVLAKLGD